MKELNPMHPWEYIVQAFIPLIVAALLIGGTSIFLTAKASSLINQAQDCVQNGYEIYLDGALVDAENITLESFIIAKIDDENQKIILTSRN